MAKRSLREARMWRTLVVGITASGEGSDPLAITGRSFRLHLSDGIEDMRTGDLAGNLSLIGRDRFRCPLALGTSVVSSDLTTCAVGVERPPRCQPTVSRGLAPFAVFPSANTSRRSTFSRRLPIQGNPESCRARGGQARFAAQTSGDA